ncbi:MAG: prepilin-type N-terminal cleavage/methylation domain-containing protein [Neisseriaceae bacterium]|nr:prepilin-type N-terminal cleavage/methylation domain-containing protein [Neisseriaceae bacterium]
MSKRISQGFTLVEVMIVVAIVAILTAIAIPSYGNHVQKNRFGVARAMIMAGRQDIMSSKMVSGELTQASATAALNGINSTSDYKKHFDLTVRVADGKLNRLEATPNDGYDGRVIYTAADGKFEYISNKYPGAARSMKSLPDTK